MIRKLLLVAAAIAMPVSAGAVALVSTATPAAAAATINCHVGGTITFASPGLTHNGVATTATTSTTTVTKEVFTKGSTATCSGTGTSLSIKSANTSCSASGETTTVPACTGNPTEFGYDSFDSYASEGVSSIKADVTTIKFKVNSVSYTSTTGSAASDVKIVSCATSATYGSESGYEITGKISAPATSPYHNAVTKFIACIGSATGSHLMTQSGATKPGFVYNLSEGLGTTGPDELINVKTALIDPKESSLNIA